MHAALSAARLRAGQFLLTALYEQGVSHTHP
jgi:hypothetical protein